jgi:steroid delta-isomerase-like uncharacterized protein
MSSEANKAVLRRFFDEAWHRKNPDVAAELFTADYILHDPGNPWLSPGPQGIREMVTAYNHAFPDAHFTIMQQVAEDDWVVTRWHVRSTHRGNLLDVAATGRQSETSGILFSRLEGGRIKEEWTQWNRQGLLEELGAADGAASVFNHPPTPEGWLMTLQAWRAAFPDLVCIQARLVREADLVAYQGTWRGTHRGAFGSVEPTGREVEVGEHRLYRVRDGQVVEHWQEQDTAGLLRQLGHT